MTNDSKNKVLTRDEVKVEETWRIEDIFATDDAWEQEYKEVDALSNKAESFKGKLEDGADALFEALKYRDGLSEKIASFICVFPFKIGPRYDK